MSLSNWQFVPFVAHLALHHLLGHLDANNVLYDFYRARFAPHLDIIEGKARVLRVLIADAPIAHALLELKSLSSAPFSATAILFFIANHVESRHYTRWIFDVATNLLGRTHSLTKDWVLFALFHYLGLYACIGMYDDSKTYQNINILAFLDALLRHAMRTADAQELMAWAEQVMPYYRSTLEDRQRVLTWFTLAGVNGISDHDLSRNLRYIGIWDDEIYSKEAMLPFILRANQKTLNQMLAVAKIYRNHAIWLANEHESFDKLSEEDVFSLMFHMYLEYRDSKMISHIIDKRLGKTGINNFEDGILLAAQTPAGARIMERYVVFGSGFSKLVILLHDILAEKQHHADRKARAEEALIAVCETYLNKKNPMIMTMMDLNDIQKVNSIISGDKQFAEIREKLEATFDEALQRVNTKHIVAFEIAKRAQFIKSQIRDFEEVKTFASLIANTVVEDTWLGKHFSPPSASLTAPNDP